MNFGNVERMVIVSPPMVEEEVDQSLIENQRKEGDAG